MGTGVFFNLPAHGHTNPTLPVVEELVKRGERIIYFSTEEFKEKIERTGAEFRSYGPSAGKNQPPGGNFMKLARMLLEATEEVMRKGVGVVEDINPDYVLHDSLCPWGKYMARQLGVRAVNTTTTFVFTRASTGKADGFKRKILRMILANGMKEMHRIRSARRRLKKTYGISMKAIELFRNTEELNLVFTSRHFQPDGESLGKEFRFIGPSIGERKDEAGFSIAKTPGNKFVYISFGTIANERADFYKKCVDAFSRPGFDVLISVGNKTDEGALGTLPPNFTVKKHVPQLEVLKKADLFISHGGMNSVNESLYFGVPLLVLPQQAEQTMVAGRVEELGAGIRMSKNDENPERILGLSRRILDDPGFRKSAEKIGETFKTSGGYKAGARAILRYVYDRETTEDEY